MCYISYSEWFQTCRCFVTVETQLCLQYAIRKVHAKGLKLNGTHHFLICGNDVNILGVSIHMTKKNLGAQVVAGKKTGLEVNAEETKYSRL